LEATGEMDELVELKGVVHVHTEFSDGSGNLSEVVSAARVAGLDFLAVTDHRGGRWDRAFPESGWVDGVLLLSGCEISHRDGHVLCFGLRETRGLKRIPLGECLAEAKRQGAVCFAAHPLGMHKPLFRLRVRRWSNWSIDDVEGLEIWSYAYDWSENLSYRAIWGHLYRPDEQIEGVPRELMRRWDELSRKKKMVGIGGLDAHGGKLHMEKLPPAVKPEIFSYSRSFGTIRTHVLSRPLTGEDEADAERVIALLAGGQSFFAYDRLAEAEGFRFWAEANGRVYQMGAEVFESEVGLGVKVPRVAGIRVIKDGRIVGRAKGEELRLNDVDKGVYRVEVRIEGKSWIYSNPIWVRGKGEG